MVVLGSQRVPTQSEVTHVPVIPDILMLVVVHLDYTVIVLTRTNAHSILMTATQMLLVPILVVSFGNSKKILEKYFRFLYM